MAQIIYGLFILSKLLEFNLIVGTEWCELGCEESQLDSYLNECRNACNSEPKIRPKNKLQKYLNCMYKSCLEEGVGPNDEILFDNSWIECSQKCDREQLLTAHEATEKPVFHIQYLSDKQYDDFKMTEQIESKAKNMTKRRRDGKLVNKIT